jgi:Arc/MetJ-type ribon-helix-helix transcriptional regulator
MGRPSKPPGEKYETHSLKFPPSLWRELEELVPPGERSAVIHEALERELKRRRRQAAKADSHPAVATAAKEDLWQVAAAAAKEYYDTDPEALEWVMFAGDTLDE